MVLRLALLVSVVALLTRPAAAQVAIGVLPVEIGGEIDAALVPTLEASIASGLETAGVSVRAPDALARAAGVERGALDACEEVACLESLAADAGVAALVRVSVSEESDIFTFSFRVFSAAGQPIGARQEGCEVCTNTEAFAALARLSEQVAQDLPAAGTLRIAVDPRDAEVRVDNEVASARELRLPPGRHEVAVAAAGYRSRVEPVLIHLGGVVQASIVLEAEAEPRSERRERMGAMGIGGWVLVGIGGGATVAGIVVAALDGQCAGGATDPQGDCELIFDDPTLAVGLGILGGGVAALAAGLVLGLVERSRRRTRPQLSLVLDPGRLTLVRVGWSF